MNNFETKMLGKPSLSSFVVAKKPRHGHLGNKKKVASGLSSDSVDLKTSIDTVIELDYGKNLTGKPYI